MSSFENRIYPVSLPGLWPANQDLYFFLLRLSIYDDVTIIMQLQWQENKKWYNMFIYSTQNKC